MAPDAPGQLLGYSLQFPRALLRLLEIGPGGAVGIEVYGDVSVFFPEGIALSEEDKSSIRGNALTDMSTNLWKSFYNWCRSVKEQNWDTSKIRFVLYTNHSVADDGFAKRLSNAQTNEIITLIIEELRTLFSTMQSDHAIYSYWLYLLNEGLDIFTSIIPRFELALNTESADLYNDLNTAIRAKMVHEADIEYLRRSLSGWLQEEMNCKIAAKLPAIITFDEFNRQFISLFQRVRAKDLIDFAIENLPGAASLRSMAQSRPVYVRQLEIINTDSSEILDAVSDFYRATTNRQEWIEREIVDEDALRDFQGRLKTFHSTRKNHIGIVNRAESKEDQGKLLLEECRGRNETLNGLTPPDKTISGTYHVLADEKSLGWHPDWQNILDNNEGTPER